MLDELIAQIAAKLHISPDQAKAGLGLVLRFAQTELGPKFEPISANVPGIADLIAAAPQADGIGGLIGSLGGMFGGEANKLGGLASLVSSAEKTGLSKDHLVEIGQQVAAYLKGQGGPELGGLLESLLK